MSLFRKYFTRTSEKNGAIQVYKDMFGPWEVSVDDCGQTTSYTYAMWVNAFKRLRTQLPKNNVKKVLMLGLGAGGQIGTINKTFPHCTLTAVEYDKEMVQLAHETQLYKPFPFPNVLLGDAKDVVPTIQDSFDLIILDLFAGPEPSPLGHDEQFIGQLRERLTPKGLLLINVYQRAEYLETAKRLFTNSSLWQFRLNNLGAFWQ